MILQERLQDAFQQFGWNRILLHTHAKKQLSPISYFGGFNVVI
jgi:hypothetical protein